MMQNIKLTLAYDGSNYLGWQKTSEGPSIEETLGQIPEMILRHPITLQAASRTDAGVHALGQVVNFFTSKPDFNLGAFKISLNRLLPKDITILNVEKMPPSFHPTIDCIEKEYRYYICNGTAQVPHHRMFSWHHPCTLNLDEMDACLPFLLGNRDFSAFCTSKKTSSYKDFFRQITDIEILKLESERICIRIKGNHFLYKMVRTLVGTLVYIGKGKISKECLPGILSAQNRNGAGVTAPAHGLFLHKVFY